MADETNKSVFLLRGNGFSLFVAAFRRVRKINMTEAN